MDPPPEPDWSDRRAVVDYIVDDLRAYAGSVPFAEEEIGAVAGRIVDRSVNIASTMTNHFLLESGEPLRPRIGEIRAPTLVLHGTEDPLFPLERGEALANEESGARLLPLEGIGHEMPPRPLWDGSSRPSSSTPGGEVYLDRSRSCREEVAGICGGRQDRLRAGSPRASGGRRAGRPGRPPPRPRRRRARPARARRSARSAAPRARRHAARSVDAPRPAGQPLVRRSPCRLPRSGELSRRIRQARRLHDELWRVPAWARSAPFSAGSRWAP